MPSFLAKFGRAAKADICDKDGWIGIDRSDPILTCGLFSICALLLRMIWNSSILIHGLGHVVLTAIVDRDPHFINAVRSTIGQSPDYP
jgi:hypothetical protein